MNKDLGFFAKHTEKLVLGVAVALLLAVVAYAWLGVLGQPHATDRGDSPSDLEDKITSAAERVTTSINSDSTNLPTRDEYIVPDYATEFGDLIAAEITQVARLEAPMEGGGLGIDLDGTSVPTFDPLFLPTPPMASSFSIKSKHGVLADPGVINDPMERAQLVEVQQIVGDQAPVDFQYVSVMAEFPLQEWAKRLDATDQPAEDQIPNNVWLAKLGIASVYLVREEQAVDGTWGNRTIIEPLPGQLAFLPGEAIEQSDPQSAQFLLDDLQDRQAELMQPQFPPMALEAWTPPTGRDRVLSAEEREQLNDIEDDIRNLERRIANLQGRDERPSNNRQRTQRNRGGMDDMGGGMGMDMGMGDAGRSTNRNSNRPDRAQQEAERQRQQIERFEEQLREKIKEKNELLGIDDDAAEMEFLRSRRGMDGGMGMGMGMDMGMGMGMDEGMGMGMGNPRNDRRGTNQRGGARGGLGLGMPANPTDEVPETVRVWAHDLTAQPGKTYRYKLVAATINPLFQYTRVSPEQREENEYRISLAPSEEDFEAAPWTTAVTLDPDAYFFFVRGNAEQDRATIEVWKVYNGLWRQGEFEETPGNPIGDEKLVEIAPGFERNVSMGVDAVLLDVDVIEINGTAQVRMVYLLPDGRIAGRLLNDDRRNTKRDELQRIVEEQQLDEEFAMRQ
ncbi:MAG: hypothetical protein AAGF84_11530 [Planctomycetota bacterium]